MPTRSRPPRGRAESKPFTEALRYAVSKRDEDGGKAIDKLVRVTLAKALDGDMSAIKEVIDRLDGKAVQPTDNKTELSGELVIHWGSKPK